MCRPISISHFLQLGANKELQVTNIFNYKYFFLQAIVGGAAIVFEHPAFVFIASNATFAATSDASMVYSYSS